MVNILDSWERAKRAPEPVMVAQRSGRDLLVDVVTGREEFAAAAEKIESGNPIGGLAQGVLTAGSFFVPWGRGGLLARGGARALGAGAGRSVGLRAAGQLGDAADGLLVGPTVPGQMAPPPSSTSVPEGRWIENPTAEELPLDLVRQFAEFDRGTRPLGTNVADLAEQIRVRGFDEPLVLEVDPRGWGVLTEGNHRLAAAELLGLDSVPVRVVTSTPGRLVGGAGAELPVRPGLSRGNLLRPSEALADSIFLRRDMELAERASQRLAAGERPAPQTGAPVGEPLVSRRGEPFQLRQGVEVDEFVRAMDFVRPMRVPSPDGAFRTAGETVYQYPRAEYEDFDLFLSDDGLSGFAIKRVKGQLPDLVSVFSAPGLGRGEAMLDAAIAAGARKLDAFDESGYLPTLYGSRGFVEVKRDPWNPEFAPKPWRGGAPDVVYMELRPDGPTLPPGRVSGVSTDVPLENQPYEGDTIMGAVMSPIQASRQFGATSAEAAEQIMRDMVARGPLRIVEANDLKTEGMLQYLDSLAEGLRSGSVKFPDEYTPFTQFQPFTDELGLQRPKLISGKRGNTFRPLFKAIIDGRYDEVLEDLAIQINNVFTLLDDDVFTLAFYPYMHNATMAGAAEGGTHPAFLSAVAGVLSAGAAPVPEARAVGGLFDWARTAARVRGGKLIQVGDKYAAENAGRAYIELVNNPDWLSNNVTGLASKTYVYAMLKMNPRMARALVIDRVDTSARLSAFEIGDKVDRSKWGWKTENAITTQGPELALGGFAERVVAATLGVPPSAVQEDVWALWRVLRDLQVSGTASRQSGVRSLDGKTIQDFMAIAKMPDEHRELLLANMAILEDEVASGGAASRYWQFGTPQAYGQRILVPKTDMPIDGYLPPDIRTPENIAALDGAIGNAEEIGRGLAMRAPWAPTALTLSVVGMVTGGALGAGQGVAQADDGSVTLAGPVLGTGAAAGGAGGAAVGALLGALTGKAKLMSNFISGRTGRRVLGYTGMDEIASAGIIQAGYQRNVTKNYHGIPEMLRPGITPGYPSKMFSDAIGKDFNITPGQASRVDAIVREEWEAIVWRSADDVAISKEIIRIADNLAQAAESRSRWGDRGYNLFTDPNGKIDLSYVENVLMHRVGIFQDRQKELAQHYVIERITQEIPRIANAAKTAALTNYEFMYGRQDMFKSFMEQTVPVIQIHPNNLRQMATEGLFYNQFLARDASGDIVTSGTMWPMYRAVKEFQFANIPLEAGALERPSYGYFALPTTQFRDLANVTEEIFAMSEHYSSKTVMNLADASFIKALRTIGRVSEPELASQYGSIAIVLKPEYKRQGTFTIGDSLSGEAFVSRAEDFSNEDLFMANFRLLAEKSPNLYRTRYIEGQFYLGNNDPADFIDYFVLPGGSIPQAKAMEKEIEGWFGRSFRFEYAEWI